MNSLEQHFLARRRLRLSNDPLSLEAVTTYADDVEKAAPKLPRAVRSYLAAVRAWALKHREDRVLSCVGLVHQHVRKASVRIEIKRLNRDDVVQEAMLSLMRGAELFDERRGYAFTTYATWWIRQAVNRVCERARPMLPLSVMFPDNTGTPGESLILDHRPCHEERVDVDADIADLLDTLTKRERRVIELRYYEELTLEEIGRRVRREDGAPLTKERVRQIEREALKRMREKASGGNPARRAEMPTT